MRYSEYEYEEEKVPNRFPRDLFVSLIEKAESLDFYGVDSDSLCIGVNGSKIALEAVADPSDGYRSYFGCWRTTEVGKVFFREPIARVKFSEVDSRMNSDNFSGWSLKDVVDGHVWLKVGTDYSDDYYPCFVFSYYPKAGPR